MSINPAILPNATGGNVVSGEMSIGELAELKKALEAGYGTDSAQLTGGGALRIQSLDRTMKSTIQENKHFVLFNELQKTNATATVDEWTEQSGIGGFLGGSTNAETGTIRGAQGDYARRVGMVKFLMTRREVSFVSTLQSSIIEAEAVEARNGALQLLTDAEYLCFEGNSAVVPTEFDGIAAQIETLDSADHVIDAEGKELASIHLVDKAAATIAGFGNFGQPTHIFMSQLTQSDFNTHLDPAFRVALTGQPQELMTGAPVKGISTSWGDIATRSDVFVRDERQMLPFELMYPSVAAGNASFKPASVTAAAATDGGADSKWGASHTGNYFYAVAGINAEGQSPAVVTSQVAVAAGGAVTITIDASASGEETGYVIYRGRKNGTSNLDDLREMVRIPRTGNQTVFVDKNRDLPGTSKAYILNMAPGSDAITWRQLLPMTKFPLYPTNAATVPWAQMLFGYLRVAKRRQHVVIKNIVPTGASWKPFA